MTDSVTTHPALASLLASMASGPAVGRPGTGEEPSGQAGEAGFGSLLQALQVPAAQGLEPPPGTTGSTPVTPAEAPAAPALFAAMPPDVMDAGETPSPPALPLLAKASGGPDAGDGGGKLPAGGMDLPPAADSSPQETAPEATAGEVPASAIPVPVPAPIMPEAASEAAMAEVAAPADEPWAIATRAAITTPSASSGTAPDQAIARNESAAGGMPAAAGPAGHGQAAAAGLAMLPGETRLPPASRAVRHEAIGLPADAAATPSPGLPAPGTTSPPTTAAAAAPPGDATLLLAEQLPALQPAGDPEAWNRGLGERLLMMVDKGLQSARLRLQPEHLGPMEVRIHVDEDGATSVLFSAPHAQTREALAQAIPQLHKLLAEQGLNLSQADVDAGRHGGFDRQQAGAEGFARTPAAPPEPPAEQLALVMGVGRVLAGAAPGRLDILA